MGTEIVFVLIYPVALIGITVAFWVWFNVLKAERPSALGYVSGYMPLLVGFVVSMAGLAIVNFVETDADFTWLVEHGHYTESQRPVLLPRRIVGQMILDLVFVLPAICFVVVPCTVKLIRAQRLTLVAICFRAAIGWLALSLVGWLWNLAAIVPPYPLSFFLESTIAPVLLYGLPIPLAALWFFRRRWMRPADARQS